MNVIVFVLLAAAMTATPEEVVASFNSALVSGSSSELKDAVGESLFMSGGRGSGDPTQWEAHMYLAGEGLTNWLDWFPQGAGPHENTSRLLSTSVRGSAALVVTIETGNNKFRSWKKERVVWALRKAADGWRVIGFHLSQAKTPGSDD